MRRGPQRLHLLPNICRRRKPKTLQKGTHLSLKLKKYHVFIMTISLTCSYMFILGGVSSSVFFSLFAADREP